MGAEVSRAGLVSVPQAQALGLQGPQLGAATKALLAWQLGRPASTKEEALQWLRQEFLSGGA